MISIWGKHTQLFKDIKEQYNDGEITDFFEYFNQSWMNGIFSDYFSKLQEQIKHIFTDDNDGGSFITKILESIKLNKADVSLKLILKITNLRKSVMSPALLPFHN